ncbi:hypothetical protein E2C01_068376 [Portunus trituberculatus]|uniref:Uncharacterized protein n=1 Tax=Portunus trituberculatus TaxID=210409 RepID=A0A5B7HM82_PORTR|nr:hypothetical protein [Portunus trituberculatus]
MRGHRPRVSTLPSMT